MDNTISNFILNFRKTKAYKICGLTCLVIWILALCSFIIAKLINVGMMLLLSLIIVQCAILLLLTLFPITIILSIFALFQIKKVDKNRKTNIVADIGYWGTILFFIVLTILSFRPLTPEQQKSYFDNDNYQIATFLHYSDDKYKNNGKSIATAFAKTIKGNPKIEGNKVITKNRIYVFNINGICDDNCNIEVYSNKPDIAIKYNVSSITTLQGHQYLVSENGETIPTK